jgi:hypothetical protein
MVPVSSSSVSSSSFAFAVGYNFDSSWIAGYPCARVSQAKSILSSSLCSFSAFGYTNQSCPNLVGAADAARGGSALLRRSAGNNNTFATSLGAFSGSAED